MRKPLSVALFGILSGDAALAGMVTGIYEHVPQPDDSSAGMPYIVLGDYTFTPFDDDTSTGLDVTITIHIWSRYAGNREIDMISGRIYELLHRAEDSITLSSGRVFGVDLDRSEAPLIESDGETRHGIEVYRILVDLSP